MEEPPVLIATKSIPVRTLPRTHYFTSIPQEKRIEPYYAPKNNFFCEIQNYLLDKRPNGFYNQGKDWFGNKTNITGGKRRPPAVGAYRLMEKKELEGGLCK
jgi:hypothetical protein